MSSTTTVHFKLPSLSSSGGSFTRFSLSAVSPSALLALLLDRIRGMGRDATRLGYVDGDGDICVLSSAEDMETALEHVAGSVIYLDAPGGGGEETTAKEKRRNHRLRFESSSSSESSDSESPCPRKALKKGKNAGGPKGGRLCPWKRTLAMDETKMCPEKERASFLARRWMRMAMKRGFGHRFHGRFGGGRRRAISDADGHHGKSHGGFRHGFGGPTKRSFHHAVPSPQPIPSGAALEPHRRQGGKGMCPRRFFIGEEAREARGPFGKGGQRGHHWGGPSGRPHGPHDLPHRRRRHSEGEETMHHGHGHHGRRFHRQFGY